MSSEGGRDAGAAWLRSAAVALAGVVAVLALVAGLLGLWTLQVATDSERFEERAEDLLRQEEVSDALARRVVEEIAVSIELDEALAASIPQQLQPAVGALLAGVRTRVESTLGERLRSDAVVDLVGSAVGSSHAKVVQVLEGDEVIEGVAVVDGEVRVNLLPVVAISLGLFQDVGLFGAVDVPDLGRDGEPDEQRALLEEALGIELAEDFGELVVYRDASLEQAGSTVELLRDVLVLARRTTWFTIGVGLVLAAVAIWASSNRFRTAAWLVAGLFTAALVVRWVVGRARDRVPDAVEQPGAKATVEEFALGLERSINGLLLGVSVAALVALVAVAVVTARVPRSTA